MSKETNTQLSRREREIMDVVYRSGRATAADVLGLMDMTRERVHAQFGITLETEIRIMGE